MANFFLHSFQEEKQWNVHCLLLYSLNILDIFDNRAFIRRTQTTTTNKRQGWFDDVDDEDEKLDHQDIQIESKNNKINKRKCRPEFIIDLEI